MSGTNIKTLNGETLLGSGDFLLPSPISTGDIALTNRALTAPTWLPADGAIYSQASYAGLHNELALLRDGAYAPFSSGFALTLSTTPYFDSGRYMQRAGHHCFYAGLPSSTTSHLFYRTVDGVTSVSNATLPALAANNLYAHGAQNSTCMVLVPPNGNAWVARSTNDGVTFTQQTVSGLANPTRIGVIDDTFVLTTSTTTYYTSTDGATWTSRTAPAIFNALTVANNIMVAVGAAPTATIYTSTTGTAWTARTLSFTTAVGSHTLTFAFNNGVWLAYQSTIGVLARSTDNCATWANANPLVGTSNVVSSTGGGGGIRVFVGKFVALSLPGPQACQSSDGLSWQLVDLPFGSTNIYPVGQELVFFDTDGYACATPDLVSWRQISSAGYTPTADVWATVAELNNVQIGVIQGSAGFYRRNVYTYNSSTQFAVPKVPTAPGVTAYIKT